MAPKMVIADATDSVSDWSLENGYKSMLDIHRFPYRVVGAGVGTGVDIFLRANRIDFDNRCSRHNHGFTISISMPGEALKMSRNQLQLPLERDTQIAIKPKWIITSDGLRSYEPHQRQCFFQSDRQLQFYKIYTKINCEQECLSNYTESKCGCVGFYMPSKFWSIILIDSLNFFSLSKITKWLFFFFFFFCISQELKKRKFVAHQKSSVTKWPKRNYLTPLNRILINVIVW